MRQTLTTKRTPTLDRLPNQDLVILICTGDFNAEVGVDKVGREDVMGRHGVVIMNYDAWNSFLLTKVNLSFLISAYTKQLG